MPLAEEPTVKSAKQSAVTLVQHLDRFAHEADLMDEIHPEMRRGLAKSELCRILVPSAFGGVADAVDPLAIAVVREALMYSSAHLDALFAMQGIGSFAISMAASDEIRSEWLPRVASLEVLAALALTEPDVGSDLRSVSTTIERRGGDLIINGHKSFITNAADAGYFAVFGKEGNLFSLVFVPANTKGVETTRGPRIIAPHLIGEVKFTNVIVPAGNRIGEPGDGFKLVFSTLGTFRVSVAGAATGLAQAALDEAVRHCRTRKQFGRPLSDIGAISNILGRAWIDVETARSITYRAADAARIDPVGALHLSSMAKVTATEAADRVVDAAVQVMGRFGLIEGSKIERLYRNSRPMRVYEGASEVVIDSLARRLIKETPDAP